MKFFFRVGCGGSVNHEWTRIFTNSIGRKENAEKAKSAFLVATQYLTTNKSDRLDVLECKPTDSRPGASYADEILIEGWDFSTTKDTKSTKKKVIGRRFDGVSHDCIQRGQSLSFTSGQRIRFRNSALLSSFFVPFVSFVVKKYFGWGQRLRCAFRGRTHFTVHGRPGITRNILKDI